MIEEGSPPQILIVDDDPEIRTRLGKFLRDHGLDICEAGRADEAAAQLQRRPFDLVVLDVMMPGEDGLALCRRLRAASTVPIILLTALGADADRIVGLELGADDYVAKPFNPRELLARIKAVLRRTRSLPRGAEPPAGEELRFGRWRLRIAERQLIDQDQVVIPLSSGEFQLLSAFLARPNMVLNRDQLLDLTRGRAAGAFDRSIDNQVSRLRKKIEDDPRNPTLIQTVWGGGYKLSAAVSSR